MTVRFRLRDQRHVHELNKDEIARRLDTNTAEIVQLEARSPDILSIHERVKFANALGVSAVQLSTVPPVAKSRKKRSRER